MRVLRYNIVKRHDRYGSTSYLQPDGSFGPMETAERFKTFSETINHSIWSQGTEYAVTVVAVFEE